MPGNTEVRGGCDGEKEHFFLSFLPSFFLSIACELSLMDLLSAPPPSTSWSLTSTLLLIVIVFSLFLALTALVIWAKVHPYIHTARSLKKLYEQWRDSSTTATTSSSTAFVSSDSSLLERTPSSNSSNLSVLPASTSSSPAASLPSQQLPQGKFSFRVAGGKLLVSVVLDVVGGVLCHIPFFSFLWAPVSSAVIFKLYNFASKSSLTLFFAV